METGFLNHNEWTRNASPAISAKQTGKSDWLRHAVNLCGYTIFLLIFLTSKAFADEPTANAGPNQITNEQTRVTLDGSASSDPEDGPNVAFAWNQIGGTPVSLSRANTSSPTFRSPVVLVSQSPVDLFFELTVTDSEVPPLSDTDTVRIRVLAVNADPVADAGPNRNVNERTLVTLNGSGSSDSDGSIIAYAWNQTGGPGVDLSGANTSSPTFTAPEITGGNPSVTLRFTLQVTDNENATDIDSVNITVNPVNEAPTANPQTVGTDEDTSVVITLTGSDPDGDPLTFSIVSGPSDGSLGPLSGNTVTYTPDQDFNGQDSFRFRVNDGSINSSPATVRINVAAVNDPPEVRRPIPDQTATEDEFFRLNVSGNFSDVDDDLSFSADGLPASLRPIGANSGIIDGTPPQSEAEFNGGIYNVTVFATDNDNPQVSSSFTLTVLPSNDVPVADNQNASTDEDSSVSITLTGSDVDGDSLTFEIVNGPPNGSISGGPPNVTYTPDPDFNGSDSFRFRVTDGIVNSNNATVSINVRSINDLPILDEGIPDDQAVEGTPYNFDVSGNFFDADNEQLTFSAVGLPPSGNIDFSGTGRFSGTPQVEDTDFLEGNTGIYSITVTATDGEGEKVSDVFRLTVAALDRANISLQISAAPTPAMLDDEVLFDFTVHNMGPQGGAGIDLSGSFIGAGLTVTPSGATTCTVESPSNNETDFSCTIGELAIGATTSLAITASTGSPGAITVAALAEGAAVVPIDPDRTNNAAQYAVGVAETFSIGAAQILGNSQILSVTAGDLNNDGAADLVVGTSAGQPVQIYLSGGFRDFSTSPLTIGDNSAHVGVALADFDNNGFLDIALANAGGPDTVYANNGGASFTLLAALPEQTMSNDVAVADFNGDGAMDIVFAVTGGNPVYLGDGSGGFTLRDTLGSANSRDVAVGLIDGNARPDIVFANVGSSSRLWTGNSSAAFSSEQSFNIGDAVSVVVAELIGEYEADALDIAFGRGSTDIGDVPENPVLSNNGSGRLSVSTRLGMAPTNDILAGDVNRDGQTDLIFVNDTGVHQIWNRAGSDFDLYGEQIFADGASAGVVTDLGMIGAGDPGGIDLAMGGVPIPGAGVFLNDGFGNLGRGDAVPPLLTLRGDDPFNVPAGSPFVDPGASATDNIDGDISSSVIATSDVNSAVVGTYSVTYDVTDFAGNSATSITRTVVISVAVGTGGGGGGAIAPLTVLFALAVLIAALSQGIHETRARPQSGHRWSLEGRVLS